MPDLFKLPQGMIVSLFPTQLTAALRLCFPGFALLLAACSAAPEKADTSPRPTVQRQEVLAIAQAYSQHRWKASTPNIKHGKDSQGIQVDTPDEAYRPADGTRPGWWMADAWNVGIPYQWGGFDSLEEFDSKIRQGFAAGDIYTPAKRAGLDAAVSQEAAGIDCSGLISRCWRLRRSYSTRELPALCDKLAGYDDLRPGDILNTHNAHVLLFAGWANPARTRVSVYEAGCHPTWKVFRRQVRLEYLKQKNYLPYRYRNIRG
ncbi:MAG TPA: hypothetical protein DCP71_05185 [Verrucomicrobiales bacterium]|nr:hypothetical protein [Verrucomicrobiales bacterium]